MQIRLVAAVLCVVYLCAGVFAEDAIKRGTYPFMAFIFYQDEAIRDTSGRRFLQGAILIRPMFLISSSPESTISHDPLSKTLLARLGATVIDSKLTLNEDEDEQEREVIEITRPYHHNRTQWWVTDITLLKTLQPFKPTLSVDIAQLALKQPSEDVKKTCKILIFKKKSGTEVRLLSSIVVDILPPSVKNCGENFVTKTMACASTDDNQLSDFCHGNSGGPLICDNKVMGLQTYINGDCSAPYLYQLLDQRKRFLDCGVNEKCNNIQECQHVCSVTLKDTAITTMPASTESTTAKLTTLADITLAETTKIATAEISESARKSESVKNSHLQENRDPAGNSESVGKIVPVRNSQIFDMSESVEITERAVSSQSQATPTTTNHTESAPMNTTISLTNEPNARKQNDESDTEVTVINLQAQQQNPRYSGRANSNTVVFQNFIYSLFLCICLM